MAFNIEKTIKFAATSLYSGFNRLTNWLSTKVPNIKEPLNIMVNNLSEEFNGLIRRTEELEELPQKPISAPRRVQPIPKRRVRRTIKLKNYREKKRILKKHQIKKDRRRKRH